MFSCLFPSAPIRKWHKSPGNSICIFFTILVRANIFKNDNFSIYNEALKKQGFDQSTLLTWKDMENHDVSILLNRITIRIFELQQV